MSSSKRNRRLSLSVLRQAGLGMGVIAAALGWCLHGSDFTSAHYTLFHPTFDGGGGRADSPSYRVVTSLGSAGGDSQTADGRVSNGHGFGATLNDPPHARADTVRLGDGLFAKVSIGSLLANDEDPEDHRLSFLRFDAISTAGGRVTFDNGWLLYEPPVALGDADTFTYTIEDHAGNLAVGLVTLLPRGIDPAPSQNLIAITVLSNGHKRLVFAGIANRSYAVEWSDLLPTTRWETLAVVVADPQGLIEWVDSTEPVPPERYYRTAIP